jgi:hypothetical protein
LWTQKRAKGTLSPSELKFLEIERERKKKRVVDGEVGEK